MFQVTVEVEWVDSDRFGWRLGVRYPDGSCSDQSVESLEQAIEHAGDAVTRALRYQVEQQVRG